jgi:hypothetical protein
MLSSCENFVLICDQPMVSADTIVAYCHLEYEVRLVVMGRVGRLVAAMNSSVRVDAQGGLATVTLTQPERGNPFDGASTRESKQAVPDP